MIHTRLITATVFVSLVSVTFGLCCAPAIASAPDMPMDHSGEHSDHGVLDSCCSPHDARQLPDSILLAIPEALDLDFESHFQLPAEAGRYIHTEMLGWPPGSRDLASSLCIFLI